MAEPTPARSFAAPAESRAESYANQHGPADLLVAIDSSRRSLDAADAAGAARWIDRAFRLKPHDPLSQLRLAALCLQLRDARAEPLLRDLIAEYPDFREPRLGLASLLLRRGDAGAAATALNALLSRIAPGADPGFRQVAGGIAAASGAPGWIGVSSSGAVSVGLQRPWSDGRLALRLDGKSVALHWSAEAGGELRTAELPPAWAQAGTLTARCSGRNLLGSPLDLRAIRRVEGLAEAAPDGLVHGWAWMPGDPDAAPRLRVFRASRPDAAATILAADDSVALPAEWGVMAPRGFRLDPERLRGDGAVHVVDSDGRPLLGSPCHPADEWRAAAAAAEAVARTVPARAARRAAASMRTGNWQPVPLSAEELRIANTRLRAGKALPGRAPIDVVLPVYKGAAELRACLASLARNLPADARIVMVDDAAPDPEIRRQVAAAADKRDIVLLRHSTNRGFPAAANTGFRHALAQAPSGHDVVLLNSDTIVPRGWLQALADLVYAAPDIGSCTPFSNDASILSYPRPDALNAAVKRADTERLARLFRQANGNASAELPSAVGFCMYIRRDCLAEVGLFREDLFAEGYGEENDWSIRAARLGWRHLAALGTFVGHQSGTSFGRARAALMQRNTRVLNRLHPGYDAFVGEFIGRDPLAPARRNVDALRWAERRAPAGSVVVITHDLGGGVERHARERSAALRAHGLRPIVLRPAKPGLGAVERTPRPCAVSDGLDDDFPNLRYALPRELDDLAQLLRPDRPRHLEVHHLVGHAPFVRALAQGLRVPYDVFIHDSGLFCPRVNLCTGRHTYCGEPTTVAECTACIADHGSRLEEEIGVAELRARSGELLQAARAVIAPSEDAARRIARQFPGITPIVQPWEPEPPAPSVPRGVGRLEQHGVVKVCVLGAFTMDKGYDVILHCGRDAARRGLPLTFVVVGYTIDDARLLETGNVFVTGRYEEHELPELVVGQRAQLGFIPSPIPESWCYALTWLWKAGLDVAAFALGAQAERILRSGRGFVLPPGLSAARTNDAFLRYCRGAASAPGATVSAVAAGNP